MNKHTTYQNFSINIKLRLAFLWTSVMFCYIYGDYVGLYKPNVVSDIIVGKMVGMGKVTPMLLAGISWLMIIPAVLIYLSIALKPKTNRIINIIAGLFYTLTMLFTIAMDFFNPWSAYYLCFGIVEIILTLTVVWYAIKWPKST